MCQWTELESDMKLDPGSGPLEEIQPGLAGLQGLVPRGSAADECSGTAGTGCKSGQAAD